MKITSDNDFLDALCGRIQMCCLSTHLDLCSVQATIRRLILQYSGGKRWPDRQICTQRRIKRDETWIAWNARAKLVEVAAW